MCYCIKGQAIGERLPCYHHPWHQHKHLVSLSLPSSSCLPLQEIHVRFFGLPPASALYLLPHWICLHHSPLHATEKRQEYTHMYLKTTMAGSMTQIESVEEFDTLLRKSQNLVADFTSGWCKPCGFITPKYNALAQQYSNVKFVVVNVDKNPVLSRRYDVKELPTFLLFRRSRKVDVCYGLDEDALETKVKKLASKTN